MQGINVVGRTIEEAIMKKTPKTTNGSQNGAACGREERGEGLI